MLHLNNQRPHQSRWGYGSKGFYAVGFGFPYLLDQTVDDLACHSKDFLETLDQYKLTNGLDELLSTGLFVEAIRTIVGEFDSWVRIKVACITDFESDHVEAAEVSFMLDELNAAMGLRIDLEESEREQEMDSMMDPEMNPEMDPGMDFDPDNETEMLTSEEEEEEEEELTEMMDVPRSLLRSIKPGTYL